MASQDSAFTLIELLVVLSVVVVLASLMLPTIRVVREAAQTMKCASNLRQIGIAGSAWSLDHDSKVVWVTGPDGSLWFEEIAPYLDEEDKISDTHNSRAILRGCPTWQQTMSRRAKTGWSEYADVGYGETMFVCSEDPFPGRGCLYSPWLASSNIETAYDSMMTHRSERPWIGDCDGLFFVMNWYIDPTPFNRHRGRMNVLYFDGHTASSTYADVRNWQDTMRYQP